MKKVVTLSGIIGMSLMSAYGAALNPDTVLQKVVTEIFTPVYQLAVVTAIIYFLYGAAKFMFDLNHPEEKNTGKQHLLWGLVGLFIILSVGGILGLFADMFGQLGS